MTSLEAFDRDFLDSIEDEELREVVNNLLDAPIGKSLDDMARNGAWDYQRLWMSFLEAHSMGRYFERKIIEKRLDSNGSSTT